MKTALTLAAIAACCATHHPDVMGQTINDNGRVTFTYRDNSAQEVDLELYIDGERETAEMDDAGDGVWIYTTSHNVPSDMTTYRFKINDEHYRLDPGNTNVVRDIKDSLNYFIIPGDPGSLYQDQNVRHGQVTALWYYSHFDPSIQQRRLKVYLPYAYLADTTLRLPVLYLLHGTGGDEDSWCDMGRLAQIMDNLIAQGRCAPMIVVMPNGTVEQDAAPGSSRNKYSQVEQSNRISWSGKTETEIVRVIIPFIDRNLRTIPDKNHRAIAGLSQGGLHTIGITANHADKFDYVGLFSPLTRNVIFTDRIIGKILFAQEFVQSKVAKARKFVRFMSGAKSTSIGERDTTVANQMSGLTLYENLDEKIERYFTDNPPKLYYLSIGRDDSMRRLVRDFRDRIKEFGADVEYHEISGGHCWNVWRQNLIDFAGEIFKD